MKQKKLLKELYKANLKQDKDRVTELYQQEIAHILDKRKAGKTDFSPKWIVTDNR